MVALAKMTLKTLKEIRAERGFVAPKPSVDLHQLQIEDLGSDGWSVDEQGGEIGELSGFEE